MYSEKLMDHYRNPRNRGEMKDATVTIDATNPVCGDCTTVQLKIVNGVIVDARFESIGCAVSVASASIMTEHIKGKSLEEVAELTEEGLVKMLETPLSPVKMGCAGMSVEALQRALKSYANDN